MGFKTFTAGSVLTAADVMAYLMQQAVVVCTSGTRPASPVAGMTIYETDTSKLQVWNGSGWGGFTVAALTSIGILTCNSQIFLLKSGQPGATSTGGYLYVDPGTGDLRYLTPAGTVRVVATGP